MGPSGRCRHASAAALTILGIVTAGGALGAHPPRPAGCRALPADVQLDEVLAAAPDGASLCLEPGRYRGPLRITARVTLWGPREAVIHSQGNGTTVSLEAEGAALLGVTVDGSGGRFDLLDAAVKVTADEARVEGVVVQNALFGLLAERASRIELRNNEIVGQPDKALGLRGDGIRIWEVRDSLIEGNRLADSRDIVVWYSPGNRVIGNRVERGRYGTHFMYSHENVVEDNRYSENVVGIFVMYSRDLVIRHNVLARSAGAAGVGLGAKESGNLSVEGNLVLGNRVGIYLDTSPLQHNERNRIERNLFQFCDTAVVFHGQTARNHFGGNAFRSNHVQVAVEGRGDAREAEWRGNEFDDYMGYDLDGDGVGDVPYELRSLSGQLTARVPALAFFRGSPALALVELVGRVVPLFRAGTLLVDPEPRLHATIRELPFAR